MPCLWFWNKLTSIFLFTQQASPRVQVDEASVTKLGEKLQKDDPTPEIFDEIQRNVLPFPSSSLTSVLCLCPELTMLPSICLLKSWRYLFSPFLQVYDMMLRDERYYPSFKQSPLYVRMLAELDMLKEPSYRGSDDGDGESFNGSPTGSINLVSVFPGADVSYFVLVILYTKLLFPANCTVWWWLLLWF